MPPSFGDRKRGPGEFGTSGGEGGGWRGKRPRFEEPVVPPATLRVLVRNHDAGGIIGKVGAPLARVALKREGYHPRPRPHTYNTIRGIRAL